MRVNFILDMERSLQGSGVHSSATRLARGLNKLGIKVEINGKGTSYDIFHFHTSLPQSLIKARLLKRRKASMSRHHHQIVMTGHTTIEDFHDSFLFSNRIDSLLVPYLTKFYSFADYLVAVSEHNRSILLRYGYNPDRIRVISNGIDLTRTRENPKLRRITRERIGIKGTQFLIINVGLCIYRKAPDLFIDVGINTPEHRFIWIGKYWPLGIIAHSAYLKHKFQMARKTPNIQFTGFVSQQTLVALWNAADIFLYASREENQGIALLEAIAYGKIPIVRKHPVFKWLTDEKECLKGTTQEEFTKLIRNLGERPTLQTKLRENGQQILHNHDILHSIRQLADLYTEIS